ncbi:MAG: hypothetical protein J5685_04015 [Clostridiales bacterium]|nr:hypothetical protein [Clostridiales bacterium]
MGLKKKYDQIKILEVEISSFSGGGYKVKYDFDRKLISWNDGYMWNNNFMKSLTAAKTEYIEKELPGTGMLEWMECYNNGDIEKVGNSTANPSSWKITVIFKDGTDIVSSHTRNFPKNWNKLKQIIEKTTECAFRLH